MKQKKVLNTKKKVDSNNIKKTTTIKPSPEVYKYTSLVLYTLLGLFVLTLIVYFPSFKNDFVGWDDEGYIHEIKDIYLNDLSWNGIKKIFSNFIMANYHPLTILIYAIEYNMFGIDSGIPYHYLNVILHLINVLLVFIFIYRLSEKYIVGLVVALLFAVHPLHVESVSWISELKDVLYSFFYLLGLNVYMKYYYNGRKKKRYLYYVILLFILSCLSKGMAVTFSVILLLIDYLKEKKITSSMIIEKIPFFIISLIFGYLAIKAQQSEEGIYNISAYTIGDRITFPFYSYMFYIFKMFFPVNLSVIYSYPLKPDGHIPIKYYLSVVGFIILVALVYWSLRKTKKVMFGFLFYSACISIVIQLLPVGINIASDRYFYISSIGLLYIVGEWFGNKIDLKKMSFQSYLYMGVLAIIVLIFSILTYSQTQVWRDSLSLWSSMLKTQQGSQNIDKAYYGVGNYYYRLSQNDSLLKVKGYEKQQIIDSTIKYFRGAINANPRNEKALNNIGNCFLNLNKMDSAYKYYNMLITVKPNFVMGWQNMGNYYYQSRQWEKAIECYDRAISIDSRYSLAYYTKGLVYSTMSQIQDNFSKMESVPISEREFLKIESQKNNKLSIENFIIAARLGYGDAIRILKSKNINY